MLTKFRAMPNVDATHNALRKIRHTNLVKDTPVNVRSNSNSKVLHAAQRLIEARPDLP